MRVFISINLNAPIRVALTQLLRALQAAAPPLKLKWVAPESQHLTLQFLGEIPDTKVPYIKQVLVPVVSVIAPFDWTLQGLGCFPNQRNPNVLWVGVHEPTGVLQRLQVSVSKALQSIGFAPDSRPFAPHLTLARVPRDAAPYERHALGVWFDAQPPPTPRTARVMTIHLMQSELLRTGARYTEIAEFTLANGR
jgi:2'-5' RNA ligase